jgi:GNAT superfamily N-acetyltransferase
MNSISTRQAVLSDLEDLVPLFDQYRGFQGQPTDTAAVRTFLRERFDHGESVVFIAHDGAVPIGFAQLYPIFSSVSLSRVFVLNDLFIAEPGRRKGTASKLLMAIEAYALAVGATRISLNVARDNSSAQELYGSQGWKPDAQFYMYHRYPNAN